MPELNLPVGRDIAERVIWTFAQAGGGVVLADSVGLVQIVGLDLWKTAALAGLTAVLALAKTSFAAAANKRSGGSTAPGVELKPLPNNDLP